MVLLRTDRTQIRRARQFAIDVSEELEKRLRERGINELTLSEHEVRRNVYESGDWEFTLDGERVLLARPAEYEIE